MPVRHDRRGSAGQVLLLYALALMAILWMVALLFDGAMAISERRRMQDATDAAALAGANVFQTAGCVDSTRQSGVQAAVEQAVVDALTANGFPPFDEAGQPLWDWEISCPSKWSSGGVTAAVTVGLKSDGVRFLFAQLPIAVDSTAINGGLFSVALSVLTLAPHQCESFQFNGGVVIKFEGGVHVNSDGAPGQAPCTASQAAAVQKGNSGQMVMLKNQPINIHGKQVGLKTNPAPITDSGVLADPFGNLAEPTKSLFGLVERGSVPSASNVRVGSTTYKVRILEPGRYTGTGATITVGNGDFIALKPGVFMFDNIKFDVTSGTFCTISAVNPATNAAWTAAAVATDACLSKTNWFAKCTIGPECGALMYFSGITACPSSSPDIIAIQAQGKAYVNPYFFDPAAITDPKYKYNGFLLWVSRDIPASLNCYAHLRGGGTSELAGTVYASTTSVDMQGGTSGAGGGEATLQFIVYNLTFGGTADFTFRYNAGSLAKFTAYGLVE